MTENLMGETSRAVERVEVLGDGEVIRGASWLWLELSLEL